MRTIRIWRRLLGSVAQIIILAQGSLWAGAPNSPLGPLRDGVLAWQRLTQETNVVVTDGPAHFVFSFTNVSPHNVTIQEIQPACGCTTAQSPRLPWIIPTGGHGQFGLTVSLMGKARQQAKAALVTTDQGYQEIFLNLNILPPAVPCRSRLERGRDRQIARADRQAIFRGDCAACHVKPGEGKDGKELYYAVCAICHESQEPAMPTPDLFAIKTPTNVVFWLDNIARGKPGTVMPAFSTGAGGPLSDEQIASLARFLNTTDTMDSP